MKFQDRFSGSTDLDVEQYRGFRIWIIGEEVFNAFEIDSNGEQKVIGISLRSKEWRLGKEVKTVSVQTKKGNKCEWSLNLTAGEEIDNTPIEFTIPPPVSAWQEIKRLVREELSQVAESRGLESFDEAMDFDVDDDPDWKSPYEITEMEDDNFEPEVPPEGDGTAAGDDNGSSDAAQDVSGASEGKDEAGGESEGASRDRGDSAKAETRN